MSEPCGVPWLSPPHPTSQDPSTTPLHPGSVALGPTEDSLQSPEKWGGITAIRRLDTYNGPFEKGFRMNMKDSPTAAQLAELLASVDDRAGHHILWVSNGGQVNLDQLPSDLTPGGWATRNEAQVQFRFETYQPGNDYVGSHAAADPEYVEKLLRQLTHHWERGSRGHIDS